jgi:hypothetical protein
MGDDLNDRLRWLAEKHRAGALSDAEYAAAKGAALGDSGSPDFAPETLSLPAVQQPMPSVTSRSGLGLLLLAVAVSVVALLAIVWLWPR